MPCCWRTAGSPSVAGCWSSGPRSVSSPQCWWCSGGGATVASCRTWSVRGERCGRRWSRSGSCCTASIWTTDDALVSVSVVFHPATRLHNPGPGHPERPDRIEAVLAALRAPDLTGTVEWVEGRPAARDQLERVHSQVYLDALERIAQGGGGALDADTVMSRDSWDAALAAAGVAIGAVEQGIERGSAFGAPRPRRPRHGILPDQQRRGGGAARPAAGEAARAGRGLGRAPRERHPGAGGAGSVDPLRVHAPVSLVSRDRRGGRAWRRQRDTRDTGA